MKKLIVIVLAIILVLSLSAWGGTKVEQEETQKSMFITIETTYNWLVVYHKDTKVMYTISRGSYNQGTFTLLVNSDGTPMIYD